MNTNANAKLPTRLRLTCKNVLAVSDKIRARKEAMRAVVAATGHLPPEMMYPFRGLAPAERRLIVRGYRRASKFAPSFIVVLSILIAAFVALGVGAVASVWGTLFATAFALCVPWLVVLGAYGHAGLAALHGAFACHLSVNGAIASYDEDVERYRDYLRHLAAGRNQFGGRA